jgi:hypothetical protein
MGLNTAGMAMALAKRRVRINIFTLKAKLLYQKDHVNLVVWFGIRVQK